MKYSAVVTLTLIALGQSAAAAEGPQQVVMVRDPSAVQHDVARAAVAVCTSAIRTDVSNEFGLLNECVNDAIKNAYVVPVRQTASASPLPTSLAR